MKRSPSDLAILGGMAVFREPLHVGRPNIGDREHLMALLQDMFDRRWMTNNGPFVIEFERRIAAMLGVRHCIATCNATVALEIAARAAGFTGEVIVPSFTFVATAHALQWQGITPVFCDIDPDTHNIDPDRIEALITPRTSGIIGVHLWGRACKVEVIERIAHRHGLGVIYDAAHAFACTHRGKPIGSAGRAEIFSFHATKFLNAFEGGAVVTNDDELAGKIRLMKNFGFDDVDQVVYIGTNGKMAEASAAMGLTSLDSIEDFIAVNRRNRDYYRNGLRDIPGISMLTYDQGEKYNYHYVVLEIDEEQAGLSRDTLYAILRAENVLARRYFYPGCHRMEPYRSYFPHAGILLPETERLTTRVLSLPTGTAVGTDDIEKVCELINFAIANAPAVIEAMA
jgi:dTDP-4-amino-4,6-dideoxygalactose transaminase